MFLARRASTPVAAVVLGLAATVTLCFAAVAAETTGESEAEVILKDSKKNYEVTAKELAECEGQWTPQTQMTRAEWAASCRSTLEYYPEGKN